MSDAHLSSSPAKPQRKSRWRRRLIFLPIIIVASLYGLSMTGSAPANLGAVDGQLAPCPPSPNCVATQSGDESQRMEPIPFSGTKAEAKEKIKTAIAADFSRAQLVSETDNYLHFEFTSLVFRFVDDVEFVIDEAQSQIHFRSASRVGHSDLGANRNRMTKISESLQP